MTNNNTYTIYIKTLHNPNITRYQNQARGVRAVPFAGTNEELTARINELNAMQNVTVTHVYNKAGNRVAF